MIGTGLATPKKEKKVTLQVEIRKKESEMKGVRNKKLKHAMKIHREGRVFTETCLRERGEPME